MWPSPPPADEPTARTARTDHRSMPSFRRLHSILLVALAAALASCENPAGSGEPGAPARLDIVSGDLQTGPVDAELPQPLVARVVDSRGRPVPGQIVNFRVTMGGGSVFAGAAVTNKDGEARERWTLGTVAADTQRVEARAVDPTTGEPLVFATFRAVGSAGAPAAITPVGDPVRLGTAGFPLADSLAVKVLDRFGNGVAGATVAWTVRRGGGTLSPPTSTANAQGVAKTQWTLGTWLDSTQVAEAAAAVGLSTSFVASAGVPAGATLAIRAGNGQAGTVGTMLAQPVKVALLLPDGRPAVGAVVAWSVGPTGGSVSPATSVTDAAGEAAAYWTLPGLAGMATLSASAPGATAATFTATASPGAAVWLARVSGNGQVVTPGQPLADSLVVRAEDTYGNAVPGLAVAWTTSNGTVAPASTTTRADGTARTQWTPGAAAGGTATATAPGLAPVSFSTQSASGNFIISFVFPTDQPVTSDVLEVRVTAQSTYTIVNMTATLGTQSLMMARVDGNTWVSPQFSLAGLPWGTYTVSVTAMDGAGGQTQASRTFAVDRTPVVEFRTPQHGTVVPAGAPVRVIAVCRDDNPAGCASMSVRGAYGTPPLATGKDSVDFMMPAGSSGDRVELSATGTDTGGNSWNTGIIYLVESGPRLQKVADLSGGVVDFDGGRAMYVTGTSPQTAHIRTLATGSEQTLVLPAIPFGTWLTPHGALVARGPAIPQVTLYEWHNGAVAELGAVAVYEQNRGYYMYPALVEGKWAVWLGAAGVLRRDLDAGTNVVVDAPGSGSYDLAPNGDVVFRRGSGAAAEVARYRNGTVAQVLPRATAPKTDGVNVVAAADSFVLLVRPAATDTLARGTATLPVSFEYDVEDGWAAYTRRTSGTTGHVWLRSPAGVDHQASALFDSARLRALGPDGQVVILASGRLWLYRAGETPVDIASDLGRPVWRNGELYILIGRTIFRVQR